MLISNINFKVLLVLIILMSFCQATFAQKNLTLRVLSISANEFSGSDCDRNCSAIFGTNNKIDWVFDIDDGVTNVLNQCLTLATDMSTNSATPFIPFIYSKSFDRPCDWRNELIDFKIEAWDADCNDFCTAFGFSGIQSDLACVVNVRRILPSYENGTYGPFISTANFNRNFDGIGNCNGNVEVRYQLEVSGNFLTNFNCESIITARFLIT